MYCYCPKVKNDRLKMPLERPLWVWWLVLIAALISFKGKNKYNPSPVIIIIIIWGHKIPILSTYYK